MRQRTISAVSAPVGPADDGRLLFLNGAAAQTLHAPVTTGLDAVAPGFVVTVKNAGAHAATWQPAAGQTVEGEPSRPIAAGECVMLTLAPDGALWFRIAGVL